MPQNTKGRKNLKLAERTSISGIVLAVLLGLGAGVSQPVQAQTFTLLHTFSGAPDGANPVAGLVQDPAGNLYGTTQQGGITAGVCTNTGLGFTGCGTVFKIDTTGNLTVLYAFQGAPDGNSPEGQLALDSAGNIYGATWTGGDSSACSPSGCGTVYNLDTSGKETVLYRFSGADGSLPQGGVILDSSGNLYGTTSSGGTASNCQPAGCGTVFKVDKKGNETVLYSFTGGTDGGEPIAGLVLDNAGNLYGTAFYGGYTQGSLCFPGGCGTVFKLTP